jgi:hypothetical protein
MSFSYKCNYCNNNHSSRDCPQEKQMAPIIKKLIGQFMEHIVSTKLKCPRCNNESLNRIGTHAPSLDIMCNVCNTLFEVKSKCLSANIIPNDLILNHGNYFDYLSRQENELDFIIIIYGVHRKTKIVYIRQIFYIPHETILHKKYIHIIKKDNSTLSEIIIPNTQYLQTIKVNKEYMYDFSDNINTILTTDLIKAFHSNRQLNIKFT